MDIIYILCNIVFIYIIFYFFYTNLILVIYFFILVFNIILQKHVS